MRCPDFSLRPVLSLRLFVTFFVSILSVNLFATEGVESPVLDSPVNDPSVLEADSPENGYLRLRYPPTEGVASDKSASDGNLVLDPIALDTAIVSFEPAVVDGSKPQGAGVRVDLVAAVHVGERSYYDVLNRRFADYDVVLYELVAEP
ncbi:MAG: hypothetical protein O2931_08195, partial [Planctomycetota bacterium]|nr:hypothetical protein [Planctomycetota bacterium]